MRTNDYRIYCKGNDYIFEAWGGSTKHPDYMYTFNTWKINEIAPEYRDSYDFDYAYVQWLAFIASTMMFEYSTRCILQLAGELYMDCEMLKCKPSEIIVLDNTPYTHSPFCSDGCIQWA